jgi:hypothetical protein
MSGHPLRRARAALFAHLPTHLALLADPAHRADRGQATAEYGLVILAAGGIALGVIAWASGTGSFTDLFEAVIEKLSDSL